MNSPMMRNISSREAYQDSLIKSPIRLLILMSLSIFLVEMMSHSFFDIIGLVSLPAGAFADALLLVILLSPMLYFFLFRPVFKHIWQRRLAEQALKASDAQLRLLSSHLLVAQETERKRISVELHDDLGQTLTFLKLRLRFVLNSMSDDQFMLKEECRENLKIIDQIIGNIRRISRDLSPAILEDLGLTASLNRLIDDFTKYYHTEETLVTLPDIDCFFGNSDRILIYRIFQEALTNISKHSQAQRVSIIVRQQDENWVQFCIDDDGGGFDVQKMMEAETCRKGLGIAALQERVRTMRGSFSIASEYGKGTKINFIIPLEKKENNDGSV